MYILLFSTTHLWNMRVYDGNNYPSQHGNNIPSYIVCMVLITVKQEALPWNWHLVKGRKSIKKKKYQKVVSSNIQIKNISVRLLSVLRGHSFFSSPPQQPMTSDFEGFLYQILFITFFSYLHSWERASISLFNVEC